MKKIILDIETKPLPIGELNSMMPLFKAAGNLKDPAKIADDIEQKRAKFVENAALSALTAEVCAVGVWEIGSRAPILCHSREEKDLITVFSNLCTYGPESNRATEPEFQIITFNGAGFDIPFLCRRALKYGKNLFPWFFDPSGSQLRNSPLIDLAAMWDCRRKDFASLNDLAVHLGVGSKAKSDELFWQTLERDPAEAEAYLTNDLFLTKGIAEVWGITE